MNIMNLLSTTGLLPTNYGAVFHGSEEEISSVFKTQNLGFHLEVMNPKTFSCPYHYHEKEEELCIVLEGEAIVRCNNEFRKVKTGDLIYYGTGPDSAHHMYNHTDLPFKFFILSTRFPDEKCFYPDSKKILDRKSKVLTQNGVPAEYFKDETNPAIYWPEHALRGEV